MSVHEERIRLFVLDRGFVVIGRASISDELVHHWRLSVGRTVRVWGTTEGLAQLRDGPTPATKLDVPTARLIPFRAVIDILDVEQEPWESHLPPSERSSSRPARAKRV